jgi:hypothetical protein
MKNENFPIGHPEKIVRKFKQSEKINCDKKENCDLTNCPGYHIKYPYFGIAKVKVLPPHDLLHPVLPLKINGKLKFVLCFKCAKEENNTFCNCSDNERALSGTFCTPELEMALNKGYKILCTHEVLHWPENEKYDFESKKGGIFSQYVNTFLKIKQESSDYPSDAISNEQKQKYIQDYLKQEGICLDPSNIQKNPGLRSVAKLALNSLYGKFGQKTLMKKTKITSDIGDLHDIWRSPLYKLCDWHILTDNMLGIEYQDAEEFELLSLKSNVLISAFCTCWARLKLLKVLQKLGDRVLYYDTDSVIFTSGPNDIYTPPLGNYLGELTNELLCKDVGCTNREGNCEGHWIKEFVGCGPKNYAYKLNSGQVLCKVRGFTLNHEGSQVLNFETMKQALDKFMKNEKEEIVLVKTQICRNKKDPCVYNKIVKKNYSMIYDKRVILKNLTSVPFGYKEK